MLVKLNVGEQYVYRDQVVVLAGAASSSTSIVRVVSTKELLTVETHELDPIDKPEDCGQALDPIAEEEWESAKALRGLLQPYLHKLRLPAGSLKVLEEVTGLGRRQLQLYLSRLRTNDSLLSLVRGKQGNKKGSTRLSRLHEVIIDKCIAKHYLRRPRKSLKETHSMVEIECRKTGLETPSFGVLRRRVAALNPYEVMKARFGLRAANQRFQVRPGKVGFLEPRGLVQIDHTQVDDMVLSDDDLREPIGRPWITLAIDVLTRVILGFYLSMDKPSRLSVGMCLSHALLPKDRWLAERGINADWPYHGRIDTLGADQAREFTGYSMSRACDLLDITLKLRQVGLQYKHGHIERLMGTMMGHVHALDGTTESNPREKGDYNSREKATMTLAELEAWMVHDICYRYHHSFHEGIGTTPAAKWDEEFKRATAPGYATPAHLNPAKLEFMEVLTAFLPHKYKSISRTGIQLHPGLAYWSDQLDEFPRSKEKFPFMYDPRDITVAYGRDSDGVLRQLHVTDPTIKRMSLYEWNRLRQKGRLVAKSDFSVDMRATGAGNKEVLENSSRKKTRKAKKERERDHQEAAREQERLKAAERVHGNAVHVETPSAKQAAKDLYSAPVPRYRSVDWNK